ncbi:DUF1963 domain-containing protein [Rhizobium sp. 2YAF20]|uniref:DUF1963 domain-containing protein n=1 Tax=Rhizobium sp. 2YAF20 TaxID=3233027 RepID=UPI003F97CF6C
MSRLTKSRASDVRPLDPVAGKPERRSPPEGVDADALLSSYRRPGLLLYRPYPPADAPIVRSRIGGLPNLPANIEWPRGISYERDVPLHFLAQIDCAELPRIDRRLPQEGVLFFFASQDEEQIWSEGEARNRVRVIFVPRLASDVGHREAPADLPPILDRVASEKPFKPDWLLPGEEGPNVHFSWPLVAAIFDTWPDQDSIADAVHGYKWISNYDIRVQHSRAAAVVAATGLPTASASSPEWEASEVFQLPRAFGAAKFPQANIMIERISRLIIRSTRAPLNKLPGTVAKAPSWIARATKLGLDAASTEGDAEEFQAWLQEIIVDPLRPPNFDLALPDLITKGIEASIAYAAGSPDVARLIPKNFYDVLEDRHLPFDQRREFGKSEGGRWRVRARTHQMLGQVSSLQSTAPLYRHKGLHSGDGVSDPDISADDEICLLRLASDPSIELLFGDMGVATFWIRSGDLEARRFDQCFGTVEGH